MYKRQGAVFELNLGNRVRLDVAAAVDHRGVGAGHFNRTGFVGGAADRIADVEFVLGDAAEAKVLQILHDLLASDRVDDFLQRL